MDRNRPSAIARVAIIGSYVPRQCGIATFTRDLRTALARRFPQSDFAVAALEDESVATTYPSEVRWRIQQERPADYLRVAEQLNRGGVDHVLVQHEYGIYGGEAGEDLLLLLRELNMPVTTTVHTILRQPTPAQRRVLDEVIARSDRVIVMSTRGADILREVHHTPSWKVDHIPHGVHDLQLERDPEHERQLDLLGKKTLLTFGLVSPDKGIEDVIAAMPSILQKVPNAVYLIVGATHPHIKLSQGETYRDSLVQLTHKLGLEDNVKFYNRYVDLSELGTFLAHTDVYVTPYLKPQQITSGTLAYAMGAGRAIISTPYWYAEELLADDRGILVPFSDPPAIAEAAIGLLTDDDRRTEVRARALQYGRSMRWDLVADKYMQVLTDAEERPDTRIGSPIMIRLARSIADIPRPTLSHLTTITDNTGILQHATYAIPNFAEGYCVDDNARALLLVTELRHSMTWTGEPLGILADRYLAFVQYAFNPVTGRFRNFMAYDRSWLEAIGSEDSHGRAVWALGVLVGSQPQTGSGALSSILLRQALPAVRTMTSPRAWAYAILGITGAMKAFGDDPLLRLECSRLTERLTTLLRANRKSDWVWFEDRLAYCNARLPQALLVGAAQLNQPDGVEAALEALTWLSAVQTSPDGLFEPVGSDRVFVRGATKPRFDQQPVDVCASIGAYLDAATLTGDRVWTARAETAYRWFLGDNHMGEPMFDPDTGAGFDGLESHGVNMNCGAESTISFLHATAKLQPMRLPARAETAALAAAIR